MIKLLVGYLKMIEILKKAALEAGNLALRYFNQGISPVNKTSHQDLVTQADIESQKLICRQLTKLSIKKGYKKEDLGFIGEEKLKTSGKYLFVIDPLDGTNNFASGFDYFCVSIGLLKNGLPQAGVVYYPSQNIFYIGESNKGVYKLVKGKKIRLKIKYKKLKDLLLFGCFSSNLKVSKKLLKTYGKIYSVFRGFRCLGSLSLQLCHFCESVSCIITASCPIWDLAAGYVLIKESGGVMVDFTGKEIKLDPKNINKKYQVVVCHKKQYIVI